MIFKVRFDKSTIFVIPADENIVHHNLVGHLKCD